jgi:DNA primase
VNVAVKFDNSIISRIQQATDIVDVISEHLSLVKKGKEMVGLCPFHADHKPSMNVNPTKQIFKCFACGAGGDVFKFVQLRENLGFAEAVERLAQRAGINLEPLKRTRKAGGQVEIDPKRVARANAWAQKLWESNLHDEQKGAKARQYIAKRQISAESAKMWGLGFAVESWDELVNKAKSAGVSEKILVQTGLAVTRETQTGGVYDKFRNRLMFPILDVTGRVVGFGGRTLGEKEAKYMNSPTTVLFDKSTSVYGLDKARHEIVSSGTAVVVEGYTDVIMAHQFGCRNVVATLGTSFTAGHARVLRRYAKRIVLVFDSDIAGTEAANRALEVCLTERIDIKLAFVGEGKDPCDFLLTSGRDAFDKVVAGAVDVMEFKWQRLIGGLGDSDNLADKRAAIEEYLRTVATAIKSGRCDPLTKGLIVNKLSGIIGLSPNQINLELAKLTARLARGDGFAVQNQKVVSVDLGRGLFGRAQREILEVLLNEPGLFENVAGKITAEAFDVPTLQEIAQVVFESLGRYEKAKLVELTGRLESTEAGAAIVELAQAGAEKGNFKGRLEEALTVVADHMENIEKGKMMQTLSDDDTESLRKLSEVLPRTNRRNPGMMPA